MPKESVGYRTQLSADPIADSDIGELGPSVSTDRNYDRAPYRQSGVARIPRTDTISTKPPRIRGEKPVLLTK